MLAALKGMKPGNAGVIVLPQSFALTAAMQLACVGDCKRCWEEGMEWKRARLGGGEQRAKNRMMDFSILKPILGLEIETLICFVWPYSNSIETSKFFNKFSTKQNREKLLPSQLMGLA
jgi:hypothetical protein